MPLYEYVCAACGEVFEEICGADSPAPACPACGSSKTEKRVSAPSPLKTGAFPFKIGPVHPAAKKMAAGMAGGAACGSCASCKQ